MRRSRAFIAQITVTPPQPVYNVAVYGLAASRNFAYSGVSANPVNLTLTAVNLGSTSESFTVTSSADSSMIGSLRVSLAAGTRGIFLLASANNLAQGPVFDVRFQGEVVPDCRVDTFDIATMAIAYQLTPGNPLWNPYADLDNKASSTSWTLQQPPSTLPRAARTNQALRPAED